MTLFFNINKLELEANGNIEKFISILEDHFNRKTYKTSYLSKLKYKNLNGSSYILNPRPLFKTNIDKSYVVQYIKLAARRDYGLFKLFKIATLDISYFPDLNINAIKHNPLLKIINNKIHFKFEEI